MCSSFFPSWPNAAARRGARSPAASSRCSLGLAPIIIQQIFAIIHKVNANGTTVFLVEQNANQALRIAHRGYVMENGRISMEGLAEDLLQSPEVRSAYLGM